ncbi:MAG TPA: potassium/proton antiporter [Phycisphaerales bacterium]|nr:potassium/proton antiporter [Phycisphaerales bacterium]
MNEPFTTGLLVLAVGVLLAFSAIFSRAMDRIGVPIVLLFLVLGMLAGSEGLGRIPFDNYGLAYRLGTVALVLILFDGGLNTPVGAVRQSWAPASILATVGVVLTAGLTALGARVMGMEWTHALLLGAIVSSTDAAAVFAVLRGSRLRLTRRVGTTLELESGANDPMAVILTAAVTEVALSESAPGWGLALQVPWQLGLGGALGVMFGAWGGALLRRMRLSATGLYPVLTLAIAFVCFGATTAAGGSGFLAVYGAGVMLGHGRLPYRGGLARVHDAIAWLSQIGMFLMLGMLVYPSELPAVAGRGLAIGIFMAVVARPVAVMLCLAPLRYPLRESVYISWVGLRCAVPIILATYPVLRGVDGAMEVFNTVFFIVVLNAIIPGATIRKLTDWLGLSDSGAPEPIASIEINSTRELDGEILPFYIDRSLAVCGAPISAVRFPEGCSAVLVVRDGQPIAARGATVLSEGDHVYIFCRERDRPYVQLLFGGPQG